MANIEEILEVKQMNAERIGIQLFLELPETLIEQTQADIKDLRIEMAREETNDG